MRMPICHTKHMLVSLCNGRTQGHHRLYARVEHHWPRGAEQINESYKIMFRLVKFIQIAYIRMHGYNEYTAKYSSVSY